MTIRTEIRSFPKRDLIYVGLGIPEYEHNVARVADWAGIPVEQVNVNEDDQFYDIETGEILADIQHKGEKF